MNKAFYIKVGKKIQEIRRDKKIPQKYLAEKLGRKSATYVNLIETGKRRISLYSLTNVAKALGVPISTFLETDYKSMDPQDLLEFALISDKDLDSEQRKMIIDFVEFLRVKKNTAKPL